MDRNNHGLSGKAFFYCRNGVKWHFDGNMIAEKRRKKSDVSYDYFKIEKKNVNFLEFFLLFQDKMIDKIWKKSYAMRKVIL